MHYEKNYHPISRPCAINLWIDYNQQQIIHVKHKEIKQLVRESKYVSLISEVRFFPLLAINCVRLLTRLLPYIFEEPEWRGFFWSDIPTTQQTTANGVRRLM